MSALRERYPGVDPLLPSRWRGCQGGRGAGPGRWEVRQPKPEPAAGSARPRANPVAPPGAQAQQRQDQVRFRGEDQGGLGDNSF